MYIPFVNVDETSKSVLLILFAVVSIDRFLNICTENTDTNAFYFEHELDVVKSKALNVLFELLITHYHVSAK